VDWVKIGGREWNVKVIEIERNFNIMDTENAGRVIAQGAMTLDRIGTFYGHKITFARDKATVSEFDSLWEYLSQPRNDGIMVELVYNQATINYMAYVSSGTQKLKRVDPKTGLVYWDSFSANFIPMKAQVIP
jgi:hypothetical protein